MTKLQALLAFHQFFHEGPLTVPGFSLGHHVVFCVASLLIPTFYPPQKSPWCLWGLAISRANQRLLLIASGCDMFQAMLVPSVKLLLVQGSEADLEKLAIVVYSPKLCKEPRGSLLM